MQQDYSIPFCSFLSSQKGAIKASFSRSFSCGWDPPLRVWFSLIFIFMEVLVPGTHISYGLIQAKLAAFDPRWVGWWPSEQLGPCLILSESKGCSLLQAVVTFPYLLSSMGTQHSIPSHSPFGCLLENLKPLHMAPNLKGSKVVCLCNKVWPQYPLGNHIYIYVHMYIYISWLWKYVARIHIRKTQRRICFSGPELPHSV